MYSMYSSRETLLPWLRKLLSWIHYCTVGPEPHTCSVRWSMKCEVYELYDEETVPKQLEPDPEEWRGQVCFYLL
jgi:hypothetical protein